MYAFLREDGQYSDPGGVASAFSEIDPLMRAIAMMSKTLSLRHQLAQYVTFPDIHLQDLPVHVVITTPPSLPSDIYVTPDPEGHASAVGSCLEALSSFDAWDDGAAAYWKSTFENRSIPTKLGEVSGQMSYCDPQTACTITLVRAARLILQLTLITYHNMMEVSDDDGSCGNMLDWEVLLPTLQMDIHKCIDDILACVPFALGDVSPNGQPSMLQHDGAGAIVICRPLRLITYCSYATPAQVEFAQRSLERLNAAIGIRSAKSWSGEMEVNRRSVSLRPSENGLTPRSQGPEEGAF